MQQLLEGILLLGALFRSRAVESRGFQSVPSLYSFEATGRFNAMNARLIPLPIALATMILGCSEAPPPIAEGNSIYRTKTADEGSGTCLGGVAAVAPEMQQPELPLSNGSSPTDPGVKVRDGDSGYIVECEMTKKGNAIEFAVTMSAPENFLPGKYTGGKTNITARGTINQEAGSGIGDVTFFIPGQGTVRQVNDSRCSFLASGDDLFIEYDGADKQTQDTGEMWITFSCPSVTESSAGSNNLCQSVGTINVSNCEGL